MERLGRLLMELLQANIMEVGYVLITLTPLAIAVCMAYYARKESSPGHGVGSLLVFGAFTVLLSEPVELLRLFGLQPVYGLEAPRIMAFSVVALMFVITAFMITPATSFEVAGEEKTQ